MSYSNLRQVARYMIDICGTHFDDEEICVSYSFEPDMTQHLTIAACAEDDSEHIVVRENRNTRAMIATVYPDECDSVAAEKTFTTVQACKNWLFDHLNDKYNKE